MVLPPRVLAELGGGAKAILQFYYRSVGALRAAFGGNPSILIRRHFGHANLNYPIQELIFYLSHQAHGVVGRFLSRRP